MIDRAAMVLIPYRAVSPANFLNALNVLVGSLQRTWSRLVCQVRCEDTACRPTARKTDSLSIFVRVNECGPALFIMRRTLYIT